MFHFEDGDETSQYLDSVFDKIHKAGHLKNGITVQELLSRYTNTNKAGEERTHSIFYGWWVICTLAPVRTLIGRRQQGPHRYSLRTLGLG
jgi:hypothetical protein